MYTELEKLKDSSRVWIYQGERELTNEEAAIANDLCKRFVEQWVAHSQALMASCALLENRFVVLAVDEDVHGASGCSIDSSVRFIQELGRKLNTSFLDRKIPVMIEGEMEFLAPSEIKSYSISGKIDENSIFFNNLVSNLGDFRKHWKQKAGEGWLSKFLSKKEETVK